MTKQPIDIARCRRAMQNLSICGRARPSLIEEAIRLIQEHPTTALMDGYLGIKNYAGFGDQREDSKYGFGPRYGTIVFSIGRTDAARGAKPARLGADEIYLLEAYRDFEPIQREVYEHGSKQFKPFPLCVAISHHDSLVAQLKEFTDAFNSAISEMHSEAVRP